MNFFSFFKSAKPKEESNDTIKIFLDDEIRRHKILPLDNDTTAESVIQTLLKQTDLEKLHHSPNIKNLYLLLMIRSSKNNTLILKRRINPFESLKDIANFKSADQEYIWVLKQLETTDMSSSLSGSTMNINEPFSEPMFYEHRKTNEPEKYERSGRLFKRTKGGDYKEKEFVLYKDNLIYFKPGEKHKKVSVIPLVDSRAEKNLLNPKEKNTFDIKTPDQVFTLKAKSEVDMKGWIAAFNSQAAIATENTIMNNIDKEIRNQEYKFEKSRNEEINLLVSSFEKFMERAPFRYLLIEFLTEENNDYKKLEPLIDSIFGMKKENDKTNFIESVHNLLESIDFISSGKQNSEEGKSPDDQVQENPSQNFYAKFLKKDTVEGIRSNYPLIKEEYKEELKEQITANVQEIKNALTSDLEEHYKRLIQGDTLFQERMTDLVKRPHYMFHAYQKCPLFDPVKKDVSPMSNHSSIANSSMQGEISFIVSSNMNTPGTASVSK